MIKNRLNLFSKVSFGALIVTIFGCTGASALVGSQSDVRIANFSQVATIDANLSDQGNHNYPLSVMLPASSTTCVAPYILIGSTSTLELTAGGSTTNLLTKSLTLDRGDAIQTILTFGTVSNLKAELVNSLEVPAGLSLFVSDLSVVDTTNYQVIIKNVTANTSTQTSPVAGVDGQRTVAYPVLAPSTYEVDLQLGGSTVYSAQVVIDANHPHNIIAFADNANATALVAHVINGGQGCVTP